MVRPIYTKNNLLMLALSGNLANVQFPGLGPLNLKKPVHHLSLVCSLHQVLFLFQQRIHGRRTCVKSLACHLWNFQIVHFIYISNGTLSSKYKILLNWVNYFIAGVKGHCHRGCWFCFWTKLCFLKSLFLVPKVTDAQNAPPTKLRGRNY